MKEFTARGLHLTRCPTTQRLRVSTAEEPGVPASAAAVIASIRASEGSAGGAASEQGGASPAAAYTAAGMRYSGEEEGGDAFGTPPSFSFASSPSEVISSLNNIHLAESIAKHKQWAMPLTAQGATVSAGGKAAAAAAVTVAVATRSDSDEDTQAAAF